MADCFFCGDFVGEINGDGGTKGRTIGTKDICEQCLGELKHWLNGTLPRAPGMRERPLKEDGDLSEDADLSEDSNESTSADEVVIDEEPVDESDPFSSKSKI